MTPKTLPTIMVSVFMLGQSGIAAAQTYPIAGSAPYQRPEGAPTLVSVNHGPPWYANALTGVAQPYPVSLRFLEHQGNWYTPFNRPGMLPPYDIRHWHQ